jgi:hypothetical protein
VNSIEAQHPEGSYVRLTADEDYLTMDETPLPEGAYKTSLPPKQVDVTSMLDLCLRGPETLDLYRK